MNQRIPFAATLLLGLGYSVSAHATNVVNVTTPDDIVDAYDGVISLREAFTIANYDGDDTDIVLVYGEVYDLTRCGPYAPEDDNADGDLDHLAPEALRVLGNGAMVRNTCVEERILDSHEAAAAVTLEALTLTGGNLTDFEEPGGAARTRGPLTVRDSFVFENLAERTGGLYVGEKFSGGEGAALLVERSGIADNGSSALFAGDFNGSITLLDSSVVGNGGTGLSLGFGPVTVLRSLIAENGGSGISLVDGTPVRVEDSTVRDNAGAGIATTGQGEASLLVLRTLVKDNGGTGVLCSFCNDVRVKKSTITGNAPAFGRGGGVRVVVGNVFDMEPQQVEIDRCLIEGNKAPDGGGGVAVVAGDELLTFPETTIRNTTLRYNSTGYDGDGGGVYVDAGNLAIVRSRITSNRAGLPGAGAGADGGGVYYLGDRSVLIEKSTLDKNRADGVGGGAFVRAWDTLLWRARVRKNVAAYGDGGGLYLVGGETGLLDSSVFWNDATGSGGGIAAYAGEGYGNVYLMQSSIYWNDAGEDGGGLYLNLPGAIPDLVNTTIHQNDAYGAGGGVKTGYGTDLLLTFTTITQNTGAYGTGANVSLDGGLLDSLATVIAQGGPGYDCDLGGGSSYSVGYNADGDGSCGFGGGPGDQPALGDPLLEPINDYGGPTWTLRPERGSPLINTVPLEACVLPFDQRGVLRPQGYRCDIGAVEVKKRGRKPKHSDGPWSLAPGLQVADEALQENGIESGLCVTNPGLCL